MSGIEFNKIFAAILLAGLVAMLAGFFGRLLVSPDAPEKPAYVVAGMPAAAGSADAGAAAPSAAVDPIGPLLASADAAAGEKTAKQCGACHNFDKGGPNKVGPNLYNIVNNKRAHMDSASYAPYSYSDAMQHEGGTWTYEELNKFIANPKGDIKGTKMSFAGLSNAKDRANVIAWLNTLSDNPAPLSAAK